MKMFITAKRAKLEQNTASEGLQNGVANGIAEMEHNNSTEYVSIDPALTKTDPAKWTVSEVIIMTIPTYCFCRL